MLRPYQQLTIDMLYDWFRNNQNGDPCIVLPVGSGKSHINAALCKDALQNWPETRILMLTHVKELIAQNYEKMLLHWPNAPVGIYSAGLKRKELGEPITFAGIQSIRNKASDISHIDLCIIDECHLISHKDEGGYRNLLNRLRAENPHMRIIGLTATPFRLGHGLITDPPALFSALIEPVTLAELISAGFLANLRSKVTKEKLTTEGVHKRGGEFIESELQAKVNTLEHNSNVVDEIIEKAGDRKSWLVFCAGVDHAENVCETLIDRGISAACITGTTPAKERDQIITDFKSGKLRALTNANVLTTGFDAPNIDLIALLRPTMSPGLYIQMVGRGTRLKDHADHCLVLDFAGVVETHGPITMVRPPPKAKEGDGEAPVKACDNCGEICYMAVKICPACGAPFPVKEGPELKYRDVDIMGTAHPQEERIKSWVWRTHTSRASGREMIKVTYYPVVMSAQPVTEYFPVTHDDAVGKRARLKVMAMAEMAKAEVEGEDLNLICAQLNRGSPPLSIEFSMDGKFHKVTKRNWI